MTILNVHKWHIVSCGNIFLLAGQFDFTILKYI